MSHALPRSHFDREVVALLGLPFDVVDMDGSVAWVRQAAASGQRCFISTPNVNFLMAAQADGDFRESVIQSDLSLADGMPLVWLARWLRLPIRERVSGAGLFERLCAAPAPPVSVCFFGGPPGMAQRADERINLQAHPGVVSRGHVDPGSGSVQDMSTPSMIETINLSQAQFVIVALGAKKGQHWIQTNRDALTAPVICHLGAVVNFAAGSVNRAPTAWQRWGLEWLWRIKEEPALWRRYGQDGLRFARFLATHLLPHALFIRSTSKQATLPAEMHTVSLQTGPVLTLKGSWTHGALKPLRQALYEAYFEGAAGGLTVDLTDVTHVDSHFIGLMMLARGAFKAGFVLQGGGPRVKKIFHYHAADYLWATRSR